MNSFVYILRCTYGGMDKYYTGMTLNPKRRYISWSFDNKNTRFNKTDKKDVRDIVKNPFVYNLKCSFRGLVRYYTE